MNETPMPVAEFERLLRLGHGRALLYLQQHDAAPYREAIVAACSNDWRYDHLPCSMCREDVVELLLDYDALPARLAEECRFDANPELRKLIREHCGPQE